MGCLGDCPRRRNRPSRRLRPAHSRGRRRHQAPTRDPRRRLPHDRRRPDRQQPRRSQRAARPLGRPSASTQRPAGRCGLASSPSSTWKPASTTTPTTGQRILAIALRDVPASPAELPLGAVTRDASSLIRQLEHRVRDLPALAQHLAVRQQDALSEADAARHGLSPSRSNTPQSSTEQLPTRVEITQRIKARHEHDHDRDTTPDAGEEAARQRQALDAANAQRLAAAAFPSPAPIPAPPGTSTRDTSRPPRQTPPRRVPVPPRRA